MNKQALRRQKLSERNALPQDYRAEASREIAKLFTEKFWQYKIYALYYNIGSEVETQEIMAKLWANGKKLLLPRTAESYISFAEALPGKLRQGKMGIMEAQGEELEAEIIVVPGICFDRDFYRIGYGKGCYDRYLADSKAVKIGLCYERMMVETVYPDAHDVRMDFVVTEMFK